MDDELHQIAFGEWIDMRRGERAFVHAKLAGITPETVMIEDTDWQLEVLANPLHLERPEQTTRTYRFTVERTDDGLKAIEISAV